MLTFVKEDLSYNKVLNREPRDAIWKTVAIVVYAL